MHIPLAGKIVLYADIIIFGLLCILLFFWQMRVYMGHPMKNPDGSSDDWHRQKIFYGLALADLIIAIPVSLLGIVLIFLGNTFGYYITAMTAFWFVWINSVCTITSVRFEKPKFTFMWFLVFPFGIIVGLIYIIWSLIFYKELF